jgi:hypothetical protein
LRVKKEERIAIADAAAGGERRKLATKVKRELMMRVSSSKDPPSTIEGLGTARRRSSFRENGKKEKNISTV